jgi:hypothetical protein
MSVRIRVYPQNGLGMNGLGVNGMGAVSAATYYNQKLQTQKQVSNLQLGYERALWGEKLNNAVLEERLKNPYLGAQTAAYGAYGGLPLAAGFGGLPGMAGFGGVPMGLPVGGMPMGGIPAGFGGSGQTNITNQTSTGAGNQTVSNVNTNNVSSSVTPPPYGGFGGWGGGGFGGGGLISGLLGALI